MDTQVTVSPTIKSKAVEPSPIPVFNRTSGVLGFSFPEYPMLELPPGKWTTHYPLPPGIEGSPLASKYPAKPIKRGMVTQYLQHDPNISAQIPYRQFTDGDAKNLTIAACYDPLTGWGRTNTAITEELIKLRTRPVEDLPRAERPAWNETADGTNTNLMLWPTTYWRYIGLPDSVAAHMRKPHHPTRWTLALTIPSELPTIPSRNIILMTMWETGHIPQEWIPHLARIKHLIVPSTHQVEIFRQHYKGDISVVPLGVDPAAFPFRIRPQRGEDEPFTILTYGSPLSSRKSPWETIQEVCYRAFSGLYGDPIDDWKLVLKTRDNVLGAGGFSIKISDPHIEVISANYTNAELADQCYAADVGVALSKFEGFGLCPLEMMSTGLPVILSKNSGHLDFCHPFYNYPVPTKRIIPAEEAYSGNEDWQWSEPDWEFAARELRAQYNLWKLRGRTQSQVGIAASNYVHGNFTWAQTAEKINGIVTKLTNI